MTNVDDGKDLKNYYQIEGKKQDYDVVDKNISHRKLEIWISSILQSKHLSLLLGNGLTTAASHKKKLKDVKVQEDEKGKDGEEYNQNFMKEITWDSDNLSKRVEEFAKEIASKRFPNQDADNKSPATFEDSLRAAQQLISGLEVLSTTGKPEESKSKSELKEAEEKIEKARVYAEKKLNRWAIMFQKKIADLKDGITAKEKEIDASVNRNGVRYLVSFLLSFASRTPNRDRLSIFTTNYDRVIEYGCDRAGIRIIDRFLGNIKPRFNATTLNIDMHYNPPGISDDPSYLPGVVRLTKLHGSLDWQSNTNEGQVEIVKFPLAFGDTDIKDKADNEQAIIYPNSPKDLDSINYPYSELFRDFASSTCRPNSSLIIYGYNFGDEHINRIIRDMLNIQSTHLLIIHFSDGVEDRNNLTCFLKTVGESQISLIVGKEIANIITLTEHILPQFSLSEILMKTHKIGENFPKDYKSPVKEKDTTEKVSENNG